MQDAMRAALTEAERSRVDELLSTPYTIKPAEDFLAGEYVQVAGQITLGQGRWLQRGVYCVVRWCADHLELMRYGTRKRIEVPHGLTLCKYPLELLVLSERAAARVIVDGKRAA